MLTKIEISRKPKKTLVLMATLRKLGKKALLEKKSKEALAKLIYSKQKGKKKIIGKRKSCISGTKKGQTRKTSSKAYESKAVKYKRAFKVDIYSHKIHIFDTYFSEDLYIKDFVPHLTEQKPAMTYLVLSYFKEYKINIKAYAKDLYASNSQREIYYMFTNDLKKLP